MFRLLPRLAVATVLIAVTPQEAVSRDWRWIKPTIESEVNKLSQSDAEPLLNTFCKSRLEVVAKIGLSCSTRALPAQSFSDITDNMFHPEGVVYGHFLTPNSEDAAVSGWSAEGHPELWGGTLLLTKRNGTWEPVWYKSSAISRSCRKLTIPIGREVLLCEEEDSGMGARVHYLYSLDLSRPVDIRDALLVTARSFDDGCTIREQVIQQVAWAEEQRRLVVTIGTPEWRYISSAACVGNWLAREKRPPLVSTISFELKEGGFHLAHDRK